MKPRSLRALLLASSWILALTLWILILAMSWICRAAGGIYDDMLSGMPLPGFTQFFLDIHTKPEGFILIFATILAATYAFLLHRAVTRTPDALQAIWVWLFAMAGTVLAGAVYVVWGGSVLAMPGILRFGGVQLTTEAAAAASRMLFIFAGGFLAALGYAIFLGILMKRRKVAWATDGP